MKNDTARACAKGWRQAGLVDELLLFKPVPIFTVPNPGVYGARTTRKVGVTLVAWASWLPLRKRLRDAGYKFVQEGDTVLMSVPDYNLVPSNVMR